MLSKKRNTYLLSILLLMLIYPFYTHAQEASAEFITSFKPAKLVTGEQARDGIKNLFFKDQKLYVTNIWSGLQILDVSSIAEPREIGVFTKENRSHNCYVVGNTAYVSSELYGVTILDVTNPGAISEIGRVSTTGDATFVVADEQYIYVAEETYGIKIYDVTNPLNPVLKGTYDTPGYAWGLYLENNLLYVADKSGGLIILDVTDKSNLKRLGQYNDMRYAKTVQVENEVAYVANGADGLWIFDVRNKAFPKLLSKITVDGYVYHAFKAGNTVFLSNETKKRMDIIDVTDPLNPKKEGDFDSESKLFATWKNDVYVFLAADTKTIIVRHNHPPIITQLDNMTVDENVPLTFTAEVFEQDGDSVYFEIENMPDGAVFDSKSGTFSWTPTYDQSGMYPGIKVTVIEVTGTQLSTNTVFDITVNHVNRAPSLPDVADGSVNEDEVLTFVLEEGSDPDIEDRGKLKYKAENMPQGANFSPASRTFSWTPTFEQSGIYTIDFIVEDPSGLVMRDGATITVLHVDRKPVLVELPDAIVDENASLSFTMEGSDPDQEDQQLLNYRAENIPEGSVFDAATATFTWTPTYDQSGIYNDLLFIFQAGNLSDSVSVNVTVNHVNRPPVLEIIADQTVNENDSLFFSVSGSDPDIEDDGKLVFTAAKLPIGSSFNASSLQLFWKPSFEQSGEYADLSFTITDPYGLSDSKYAKVTVNHINRTPELEDITAQVVDENSLLTFDLIGSDPDIEDKTSLVYSAGPLPEGAILEGAKLSWTPTYDQSGSYTADFTVSDGRLSVTKTASITVNHVNRAPEVAEIPVQNVAENTALQFTISGSDPDTEDQGKYILSAKNLPEGSLFDPVTGTFNWTPTFEQSGEYTVTFVNTDPQGLFGEKPAKIMVSHVNRTPKFGIQSAQTIDENSPLSFTLIAATDPDKEDEGKLIYIASGLPEGATFDGTTLTFNWTPTYEQSGKYTITFTVKDSEFSVDQPVQVTVNHINLAPEVSTIASQSVDENSAWLLNISVSDPDKEDSGKLVTNVSGLPQGALFDPTANTIAWTPGYEESGTYPGITVTVNDPSGMTAQQVFDLIVNHVNRKPEINPIPAISGKETETLTFSASGSDPDKEDQNNLTFSVSNEPSGSSFTANTFSWTPSYDQAGDYSIIVTISDGQLTASTDVTIAVENVNRDPQIGGPANADVEAGSSLSLSYNGSDPDNDKLSYRIDNAPSGMTIDDGGNLSWIPTDAQVGSHSVQIVVSDGNSEASTALSVAVAAKPLPPPAPADTTGNK